VTLEASPKLDAEQLRFLLREHTLILEPGEVLVVMVRRTGRQSC
jgi:hypothetical protein